MTEGEDLYPVRHRMRYRIDSVTRLNILLIALVLLIAMLWMFIFTQFSTRVPPVHFTLNEHMQIFDSVPLEQEGIDKPALLNWVNEMVRTAFSFNYSNQSKQATRLAPYFSEAALKMYLDMLQNDDDFSRVQTDNYVVSIYPSAAPEILVSKAFKGRYAWQVEIQARVQMSNALKRLDQVIKMDFLIWRVSYEENPLGITVANFNRVVLARTQPRAMPRTGQ